MAGRRRDMNAYMELGATAKKVREGIALAQAEAIPSSQAPTIPGNLQRLAQIAEPGTVTAKMPAAEAPQGPKIQGSPIIPVGSAPAEAAPKTQRIPHEPVKAKPQKFAPLSL